ncbi:MAG: prolyl oligopeptidase family serine peptidase [Crocinitomicaceae bacterium]|jgi:dipeptidyl aminopeptidase/acylaminoacyl peptidase|nr:prolyl oligopeptidase family serine peptidase [Crocinitomicaceae bacterium]
MRNIILSLTILFSTASVIAQTQFELSEIMKGKDFMGYWPENVRWHASGKKILFQWNPNMQVKPTWHSYDLGTGKIEEVSPKDQGGLLFFDRSQAAYPNQYFIEQGILFSYNKAKDEIRIVWAGPERVRDFTRYQEEGKLALRLGDNLFELNVKDGQLKQLTNFELEDEKLDRVSENYLSKQQEELFQFIQEQKAEEAFDKQRKELNWRPKPLYFGKNSIQHLSISPNGKDVYVCIATKTKPLYTDYAEFVNDNGQTTAKKARPKVGQPEPFMKLFHYNTENGELTQVSLKLLTDFQKRPSYLKEYGDSLEFYPDERLTVIQAPIFSKEGKAVFDIRSCDNKDRWLVYYDVENHKATELNHQHDEAWIGGPGIEMWDYVPGTLGFIGENEIYFQSEKSGFSHLYSVLIDSKKEKTWTKGEFEIRELISTSSEDLFYLITNETHPGDRGLYLYNRKTGEMKALWTMPGAIEVTLSPDEKTFAARISTSTSPWEVYTLSTDAKKQKKVTQSTTEAFNQLKIQAPANITFKGMDNKDVYARMYKPDAAKDKKAAVIFVHGAGYLQNAHRYWSAYYHEFLFHQLLIDSGYTVLDIDYRASDGYGRDCRTAIYRHMGGWDLNDQLSGREYLIDSIGIPAQKIGIYGGSYGGFMTLMALLTQPDKFACGAALRSVTDWAHYNHEYTSNILNYPDLDPKAYEQSSPIYFAENLASPLLMLHGMVDDNVQFQDVVRLSQRFIELGKKNWNLAVFPVEPHGFVKSYSWTDEYRRILELFNENLLQR